MSDEELETLNTTDAGDTTTRVLTAEYKDGQLEIVEMTPYERDDENQTLQGHIIQGSESNDQLKYVQVLDSDKNVVLDLLNLTLVKCEDGQEEYRLVTNDGESGDDTTVTCVLSNEDDEDHDNRESYVVLEGEEGPMVFLPSTLPQANHTVKVETEVQKSKLTPIEILDRAKALQKAKALMAVQNTKSRKRKGDFPPPHELLSSPQFKLFLYSCKMCSFKCNAIKELTAHKAAEHSGGAGKCRGRAAASALQCARCPFRAAAHAQLMKHVKDKHVETIINSQLLLESDEARAADVLVCGACGFESGQRDVFRDHIETEHGVASC